MSARRDDDLARYYDLDLVDDPGDLDMYLALAAAADGPILEPAAGSGRVCVALAAAGHDVTGVDRDPRMLERARVAWESRAGVAGGGSLRLVDQDITRLDLEQRFGLVIVALNSLVLLDGRAVQKQTLEVIARHLVADGRAVIDVWLPTPDDLALYDGRLVLDWVRRDEETGEWVAKSSSARFEAAAATAEVTSFFDAWREDAGGTRRTMRGDQVAFIGASELVGLAESAGLVVETLAGDYSLTPFSGTSERIVMIGRLPSA
jgi:SAM-dependent methyltransferase